MIKQIFERMLLSRTGQVLWSAAFCAVNVGLGLLNTRPFWSAVAWACAGFLLANTIHAVFRDLYVRCDYTLVNKRRMAAERAISDMVEHMKGELQRYADERDIGIDIEIGRGAPPPRWRQ